MQPTNWHPLLCLLTPGLKVKFACTKVNKKYSAYTCSGNCHYKVCLLVPNIDIARKKVPPNPNSSVLMSEMFIKSLHYEL